MDFIENDNIHNIKIRLRSWIKLKIIKILLVINVFHNVEHTKILSIKNLQLMATGIYIKIHQNIFLFQ